MNLLIAPLLVIGLLASPSAAPGECVSDVPATRVCENCASPSDRLDRQARKHTAYYLALVGAQAANSEPAEARQYSVRTDPIVLTDSELLAQ